MKMGKEAFRWNGNLYAAANKVQAEVGERLISRTPFSEAALVLDVGCGSGNLTFKIGAKVPKGKVTAISVLHWINWNYMLPGFPVK